MRLVSRLGAVVVIVSSQAFGAPLVTPSEMVLYNPAVSDLIQPASSPILGAPSIEVASPRLLEQPIKSPMRIELVFKPTDAPVVMESLQVLYGSLKLNITSRILREATVSNNSIRLDKADLPAGEHRFQVQIADAKGRFGNREISVKVE